MSYFTLTMRKDAQLLYKVLNWKRSVHCCKERIGKRMFLILSNNEGILKNGIYCLQG